MCMACVEYTKDKLTLNEFSFALREMTWDDKKHADDVAALMKEFANDPDELKKQLKLLADRSPRR